MTALTREVRTPAERRKRRPSAWAVTRKGLRMPAWAWLMSIPVVFYLMVAAAWAGSHHVFCDEAHTPRPIGGDR